MDFSSFGSLAGGGFGQSGGILAALQRLRGGGAAAPAVPADGTMQPTIGPGAPPAAVPQATVKMGLPPGGILGLLQGQSPQGLLGMLQRAMPGAAGAPLAGGMPTAGMIPGTPGAPMAAPATPPQLPMDINPMNQF